MKIVLTLFYALVFMANVSFGQSAFYDAMALSKKVKPDGSDLKLTIDDQEVYKILLKYLPDLPNTASGKQIKDAFDKENNPFINKQGASILFPSGSQNIVVDNTIAASSSRFSEGANISKIADGLAQFLVERFKEELNIHFIGRFKNYLEAYPEAKTIFPQSYSVLKNIDTYQYASILLVLKEAFEKDIELLALHLPELRDLKYSDCTSCPNGLSDKKKEKCVKRVNDCKTRIDSLGNYFKTEKGVLLMASLISIREIQQGKNPVAILNTLAEDKSMDNLPTNLNNALKLSNLFSQNMLNDIGRWASPSEIKLFLKDKYAVKLFLGLLYQKAGNDLKFAIKDKIPVNKEEVTFRKILEEVKPKINLVKDFISDFSKVSSELEGHFFSLKTVVESKQQLSFYDYHKFFISLGDLVETSLKTEKLFALAKTNFTHPPEIKKALDDYYRPSLNIAYDLYEKKYSAAVYGIADLLINLGVNKEDDFISGFKKYGLFVAEVSKAETSAEVKSAIASVALPVGSARIKRETQRNIALQAYLGGFFGSEFIPELASNSTGAFTAAVHAPVGIAFSLGTKNQTSWTLFFPVIDIGAVTAYRFKDDQTEALPDFTFQNILAPGTYLIYGFKHSPISLGVGAQMGPAVRKLSKNENGTIDLELNNRINWRIGATLVVDIPLINLSTKPRIK